MGDPVDHAIAVLGHQQRAIGQAIVNGYDNDGFIGVYEINGSHYWWLCIEPEGTPAADAGFGFLADAVGFQEGWDQQNTERQTDYANNPAAQAALPQQIVVMQYVLDTYLPIPTLTTPGMLQQGSELSVNYGTNNDFYNSMYAVQQFLTEMYGKPTRTDFSDLSDFANRWENIVAPTAAETARSDLYDAILADIEGRDPTFFDTYAATFDDYYIANTLYSLANNSDPLAPDYNWQDALIIAVPVPEPSGALLIGCFGLAVMLRRWRKLA